MATAPHLAPVHIPCAIGRCKHKLSDILMIAPITYICDGWDCSDLYSKEITYLY